MGDYVVSGEGPRISTAEIVIALILAWGVNIVALLVVDWVFDSVEIGRWWSLLLGAAVLGVANAILKPILVLLTFPLIVVTLGLAYLAINIAMLALAEWVAPDFSIDGFWTYVGAVIVMWLVNWALGSLVGSFARRAAA
ncbi:MAG TPA: phage holin family protein [Gaiellaceae bacterium]|nr:phage holin family protein [Gaiellaceae bacterium]